MHKYYNLLIIVIITLVMFLALCRISTDISEQEINNEVTFERIEEFAISNNIKVLNIEYQGDYTIVSYDNGTEYGIMKLYFDESSSSIKYLINSASPYNYTDRIVYTQFIDKDESYVGIYILDKGIMQIADDVSVSFKGARLEGVPFKISVTVNGQKSVVISTLRRGDLLEMEKISIRDKHGNIIYTKIVS
ncbi:MAG: hypothetical protein LRZ93_02305 [Clostridiales bacterium]|nr:hypothetical protein [Clostridiales bacterium]